MRMNREEGATIDYLDIARLATRAALEKMAEDLVVLDVRGRNSYCDAFVLCNGKTARQVKAIAEHVLFTFKHDAEQPAAGVEGLSTGRWVLIDLGDVLVHVFDRDLRGYYDLDGLWLDAPRISLEDLGLAQLAQQVQADSDYPALLARAR